MKTKIMDQMIRPVKIEGPVPASEKSYPFCSMKHCREPYDLEELGYSEEEYFIEGRANIYDADENDAVFIKKEAVPYRNRMIVRYPKDTEKCSGRVYLDILNATNGYDHEDLWSRIYDWCVRGGHIYIGLTSKPVNVASLKRFDYARYRSLSWPSAEAAAVPAVAVSGTIDGCEEGLFWDMLHQLAYEIRHGDRRFLGGNRADFLYLTGQSQSGAYLNTYIHYFDALLAARCPGLYSGYFNIVGAQIGREICQGEPGESLTFGLRRDTPTDLPFIAVSSEGDFELFKEFGLPDLAAGNPENADREGRRCRYYEIPGASHFYIKCPVLPSDADVERSGNRPHQLSQIREEFLSDLPLEYYVQGLLDKLHRWAADGEAPEEAGGFERSGGELVRDGNGNVRGGLRNPYVEVPAASYTAAAAANRATGEMVFFDKETFLGMYGSAERYREKFAAFVEQQKKDGWIDESAAMQMIRWSEAAAGRYED